MNNPQLENGYTRIANEIIEQFAKIRLSPNEWRICWVLIRKTYGYRKKEDAISLTQFQKITNLSRPSVVKAIKKLVAKQILLVAKQQPFIHIYGLNKTYSQWTSSYLDTSSYFATRVVAKQQPKLVAKQQHTKEKKENILNKYISAKAEKNINHPYKNVIKYCREKQGIPNEYINYVKQTTGVKKILMAGYSLDDIMFVIDEMSNEPYWKENPFDLMSVANQMHKYMNRVIMFKGDEKK